MKKTKEVCIFIIFFIVILSSIIIKPINDLDEIWNYNFARNIANGLVPYRDFNMIVTPFTAIITGIILRITFDELIVMRIIASILASLILLFTYKIFLKIKLKSEIAFIFTASFFYLFKDLFCIDYNFVTLLVTIIIIYIEIKQNNKANNIFSINKNTETLIGFLSGVALITKQTSGIIICIVALGNKLLFARKKEHYKTYLKSFFLRIIGIFIPILTTIVYLLINNSFKDFVSYTIQGINSFDNFISYNNLFNWNSTGVYDKVISILALSVPLIFIHSWYICIVKEKEKNIYYLLVYGLGTFIITFPISNCIHFLIGSLPWIIVLLYYMYVLLYKIYSKTNKKRKIFFFLLYFMIFIITFYTLNNYYKYIKSKGDFSELKHFKYIIIDNKLENQIEKVSNYIKNNDQKTLILDSSAAIYMIPIDRYNKDYDMFNKGNFGIDGENRLRNSIKSTRNIKYLILKDKFSKNWQTPSSIIDNVKENKENIGEIEVFDIYQ